jgi:hypothetical protein
MQIIAAKKLNKAKTKKIASKKIQGKLLVRFKFYFKKVQMNEKSISSKELQRNLKTIACEIIEKKSTFLVIRNSKPAFRLVPVSDDTIFETKKTPNESKPKIPLKAQLTKLMFKSTDKNLSKKIDSIVYNNKK